MRNFYTKIPSVSPPVVPTSALNPPSQLVPAYRRLLPAKKRARVSRTVTHKISKLAKFYLSLRRTDASAG